MQVSRGQMFVEKVDGSCVRLEPFLNASTLSAGAETTITGVIVEVSESTPATGFWGTAATCHRFDVIVRRIG
ncbi:MAG: hypothetical protein HYV99_01560 [Betaproteobacteria bacterium]|nr:hypothetical protein [Betaproteobacteria bacterium]